MSFDSRNGDFLILSQVDMTMVSKSSYTCYVLPNKTCDYCTASKSSFDATYDFTDNNQLKYHHVLLGLSKKVFDKILK